jgi:hypothetical protein
MNAVQEEEDSGDAIESSPKDLIETVGEIEEAADTNVTLHEDSQVEENFITDKTLPESNVPEYYEEPEAKNQKVTVFDKILERTVGIERTNDPGEDALSPDSNVNTDLFRILGILMIIFGGLLLIASLFIVFGFNGLSNLFANLVFSGNGFVAGFLGFLLFLLILVLVILFVIFVQLIGGPMVGLIVGGSLVLIGVLFLILSTVLGG